jgi:HAD superfamily hydrolase (TIGR01509 family)
MVKAIIFDLDGTLIALKNCHYEALNKALGVYGGVYKISLEDHYSKFDGLPTKDKLNMLTNERGLPPELHKKINEDKQKHTIEYIISNVNRDDNLVSLFSKIKEQGIKIIVASNSVTHTIYSVLVKQEVVKYVDLVVSNQDVVHPKPNPEMFLYAFARLGLKPKECIILEDSPYGLDAARESGGHVLKVSEPSDITFDFVNRKIMEVNQTQTRIKWDGKNYNILIPMSGLGSRFSHAGYTFPKPLIEVKQKPMVQVVVENLNIEAQFIYVVQEKHYHEFNLKYLLNLITPGCKIVLVDGVTEGAACSTLLAKEYINDDKHLLIANSDQFLEWDSQRFYYSVEDEKVDGGILCFKNTHPKWSYVETNEAGYIMHVAEKEVISDLATVGVYWWNKGSDYVKYAEQMIDKGIRYKNEFYVAPVYNEGIEDGLKVKPYMIEKMWGIGTPEDLNFFLQNYKGEV